MAWLAHIDMVKFVVASGLESALIIEDDVNWDVTIREQMRLVSENLRDLLEAQVCPQPLTRARITKSDSKN